MNATQIKIPEHVPQELHERFMRFWKDYTQAVAFTSSEDSENGLESLFSGSGDFDSDYEDAWSEYAPHLLESEREEMLTDAAGFFMDACNLILNDEQSPGDDERAGRDFHFSRNSHGCGFFDGDWEQGSKLQEMAKTYSTLELMGKRDSDGKIEYCYLCH